MLFRFSCPHCGKSLKADPAHAGRRARCSGCGASIVVPQPESAGKPPPAPPGGDVSPQDDPLHRIPEKHLDEELVDMTAMVDIVFFLLIFFMVTSIANLQAAIKVPAPEITDEDAQGREIQSLTEEEDFIHVRIDADDLIWVEDKEAPTIQELVTQLRERQKPSGDNPGLTKMHVDADGDARHETVVRVLDAGAEAEIEEVRLAPVAEE